MDLWAYCVNDLDHMQFIGPVISTFMDLWAYCVNELGHIEFIRLVTSTFMWDVIDWTIYLKNIYD